PTVMASGAASTYQWDLVTTTGGIDSAPIVSFTTTSNAQWSLAKASVVPGSRVRLTVTSPGPLGACAAFTTAVAYSSPLNPPPADLAIGGGCTNGGPPCSFNATSATPPDSTWSYAWSGTGPGTVSPANGANPTYSPAFSATGTYTIALTVTN